MEAKEEPTEEPVSSNSADAIGDSFEQGAKAPVVKKALKKAAVKKIAKKA